MAGFTATEAIEALPRVTDLAVVAQTDLATATDIASDSIGAFGLEVSDLNRLNDVFARTMTTSNTNMENLFEAVKKGAPSFTAAGQSLESFNALLGVMANSGVKGAEAGTALRNIMLKLSAPSAEAQRVLEDLGVTTQDQAGNFLDIVDILGQFERGLADMGSQQRTAALSTIFGTRAVTGVNLLLQEGTQGLREYREQLEGATGASQEMGGVIGSSIGNRLKGLKSAVIEAGFTFVSAFEDVGGKAIDNLTQLVRNVDLTAIAEQVAGYIEEVVNNMPAMIEGFKEVGPQIQQVASEILDIIHGLSGIIGFFTGRRQQQNIDNRIAEIEARRAARSGVPTEADRQRAQEAENARNRAMEDRAQRHDIYLHGRAGEGLSNTPGGIPEPAVALGAQ
jgi:TP901 family phage tail tape measure protein